MFYFKKSKLNLPVLIALFIVILKVCVFDVDSVDDNGSGFIIVVVMHIFLQKLVKKEL